MSGLINPDRSIACVRLPRRFVWHVLAVWAAGLLFVNGQVVKDPGWLVCYNLPSQDARRPMPGEHAIRDTILTNLNRLQRHQAGTVATYTLSGDSDSMGAAGPILAAIHAALQRGVALHLIVDRNVSRSRRFGPAGHSLNHLARLEDNPLTLSVAPDSVLMHHKFALFDFGPADRWTLSTSWNVTGGASIFQWNIGVLIRSAALYAAFAAEADEFRAGRFGSDKHRRHDGTRFRVEGGWAEGWVRFSPYPDAASAPPPAEADIVRLINTAEREIYFALNKLNRPAIRDALVAAADRGVVITGVVPASDLGAGPYAVSGPVHAYLGEPDHFRNRRPVRFLLARTRAEGGAPDDGRRDLVHTKYMVIDPGSWRPLVIHGSANWTAAGLAAPDGNDEHILFLPHREIARAFMEQFLRLTGGFTDFEQ